MLKIRLRQMGRTNHISYRLVVADSRSPRDGKYVEMIGWYKPLIEGNDNIQVQQDRLAYWLDQGAVLTEKAKALVHKIAPETLQSYQQKKIAKQLKSAKKKKEKAKQ